jgi:hypothetical protein
VSISSFVLGIAPGVVARVLGALGLGVASIAGLSVASDHLVNLLNSSVGGLTANMAALAGLAGVGQGISYITGAIVFRVSYLSLLNSAKIIGIK